MITAVDSSVLLDVLIPDPEFGPRSSAAYRTCVAQGSTIACGLVWAEVAAWFPSQREADQTLRSLRLDFSEIDRGAALAAGDAWRAYRRMGGPRRRFVADFVVGAHAALRADRLLTRDRGFYRRYFNSLTILDPSKA